MNLAEEIRTRLSELQDKAYREFQIPLFPSVNPDRIIGVRTPALRSYAKELSGRPDVSEFLDALPHPTFDENQLHAFIISGIRDYGTCLKEVCRFLPYVDNWATCDQLSPKVFRKHRPELLEHIREWIASGETYTVRFAVGMLMEHFLDEDFDPAYPEMVAAIRSEEYYVRMMVAWYFATALAKQYDAALPYIRDRRLDDWTHQKTIQKAVESYRIPDERKALLKSLRIRK
jgi:3-methyladenine DNA glycosylase AlkD